MRHSPLSWSVLFLCLSSYAAAQQLTPATPQPALPVRDPQAVSVLMAAVAALGRTPPADSTASGTVTVTSGTKTESGTFNILTLGVNQSVEEINLPGSVRKTVVSGWVAASDDGTGQALIPGQTAVLSQLAYFPLPLLAGALANPDYSFQYVGLETIEGASVHHIRMWTTFASKPSLQRLAKYSSREMWIDAASYLPRKVSFTQQGGPGEPQLLFEIEFSSYRNFSGVMYPTVIQKSLDGTPWITMSISNISFNAGLTETPFTITCTN
jgi:hypothetical protein